MAYLVVFGELAIGLGLVLGFLTPIAAAAGLLLNLLYFVLMIHDWAEQGQNSMMALISRRRARHPCLADVVGRRGHRAVLIAGSSICRRPEPPAPIT